MFTVNSRNIYGVVVELKVLTKGDIKQLNRSTQRHNRQRGTSCLLSRAMKKLPYIHTSAFLHILCAHISFAEIQKLAWIPLMGRRIFRRQATRADVDCRRIPRQWTEPPAFV